MITPEEFAKFELLLEKLKLLVLSDVGDKFYHINQLAVQIIFLKNEGNRAETAKELGLCVKTLGTYLKDISIDADVLDMHLDKLAMDGWFKTLPQEEQEFHLDMVRNIYSKEETATSVQ